MAGNYSDDNSFLDFQLRMLRLNDENFKSLSLNLNRMEKDFSQQLAHWRESLFSFQVTRWLEVIRLNTTVEIVTVELSLSQDTIWKKDQLRLLMEAIGSLPNLRKLVCRQNDLGQPRRLASIDAITLAVSRCHQELECFELWGNDFAPSTEAPLVALTLAIESCPKLNVLKVMGFHLSPEIVALFTPLMPIPSLREFGLGYTSNGFLPVAQALETNTNLEKLSLSFLEELDDSNIMALVHALEKNTNLQMLSLWNTSPNNNFCGISSHCQQAFLNMIITHNMTLADVKTRGDFSPEIMLYVKLNRAGRQHLFHRHGVSREKWVDKVICTREDIDCTYYFLTMNPSICVT